MDAARCCSYFSLDKIIAGAIILNKLPVSTLAAATRMLNRGQDGIGTTNANNSAPSRPATEFSVAQPAGAGRGPSVCSAGARDNHRDIKLPTGHDELHAI